MKYTIKPKYSESFVVNTSLQKAIEIANDCEAKEIERSDGVVYEKVYFDWEWRKYKKCKKIL